MMRKIIIIGVIATIFLFVSNTVAVPQNSSEKIMNKLKIKNQLDKVLIKELKEKLSSFTNKDLTPFGLIIGIPLLLISLWFTFQGYIGSMFSPVGLFILALGLIGDIISILIIIFL